MVEGPFMSNLHNFMGLFGCMLILVALPLTVLRQPRFSRKTITITIFTMMGLAAIPVYDLPIVAYMRAVIGDLSITSLLVLCIFIASAYAGRQYLEPVDKRWLTSAVLVCALIVYPLGLGLTMMDTYALGYGSLPLFTLLLASGIFLLWQQRYLLLTMLLVAIGAYLLTLLATTNLWDYLFDPWIAVVALTQKVRNVLRNLKNQPTKQSG